ncbi:SDR family NAD(P)-dependent oxidoreductase [Denitromonas iodatirespirans]|uniref:SDR family NAD(P)-dependent oxidoreductase n=1 Tax=Denitromonas iodatirespirans TaxID=2795389 RepID=A0A944DBP0_DENI1|nr:SDR family NAD(P)-dependent oxidoreductase [Denitromonas iodatirespirans]MBT0962457.1 SDR family NAD(P)-dependent oxidoreductase [Denitromonas iodatirespirans]
MSGLNPPIADWRGRHVWLIGASSGIGEALAHALAGRGAMLALSGRRADALDKVAEALGGAEVLPLDITVAGAVAEAWEALLARWGGCDMVVFVAGTYQPTPASELSAQVVERTVAVNLSATLAGVAAVLPAMLARGAGHIALVSSVAGYSGLPKAGVYGATKAGLINFAESLFLELRPRGLGVHLINPGFVATRLTADNDFPMPALISPAAAAAAIVAGLSRGDFEIHFPKRFSRVLKLLRLLPYRLYFPLVRRVTGGSKT